MAVFSEHSPFTQKSKPPFPHVALRPFAIQMFTRVRRRWLKDSEAQLAGLEAQYEGQVEVRMVIEERLAAAMEHARPGPSLGPRWPLPPQSRRTVHRGGEGGRGPAGPLPPQSRRAVQKGNWQVLGAGGAEHAPAHKECHGGQRPPFELPQLRGRLSPSLLYPTHYGLLLVGQMCVPHAWER